jgi:hypothetical protein
VITTTTENLRAKDMKLNYRRKKWSSTTPKEITKPQLAEYSYMLLLNSGTDQRITHFLHSVKNQ